MYSLVAAIFGMNLQYTWREGHGYIFKWVRKSHPITFSKKAWFLSFVKQTQNATEGFLFVLMLTGGKLSGGHCRWSCVWIHFPIYNLLCSAQGSGWFLKRYDSFGKNPIRCASFRTSCGRHHPILCPTNCTKTCVPLCRNDVDEMHGWDGMDAYLRVHCFTLPYLG